MKTVVDQHPDIFPLTGRRNRMAFVLEMILDGARILILIRW